MLLVYAWLILIPKIIFFLSTPRYLKWMLVWSGSNKQWRRYMGLMWAIIWGSQWVYDQILSVPHSVQIMCDLGICIQRFLPVITSHKLFNVQVMGIYFYHFLWIKMLIGFWQGQELIARPSRSLKNSQLFQVFLLKLGVINIIS